jgi:hypothetical protein
MPSNVKVNFALEQAKKAQGGLQVKLYSFFNIGTRWGRQLTPRAGRFNPGKKHGALCTEGWMGPRTSLE